MFVMSYIGLWSIHRSSLNAILSIYIVNIICDSIIFHCLLGMVKTIQLEDESQGLERLE